MIRTEKVVSQIPLNIHVGDVIYYKYREINSSSSEVINSQNAFKLDLKNLTYCNEPIMMIAREEPSPVYWRIYFDCNRDTKRVPKVPYEEIKKGSFIVFHFPGKQFSIIYGIALNSFNGNKENTIMTPSGQFFTYFSQNVDITDNITFIINPDFLEGEYGVIPFINKGASHNPLKDYEDIYNKISNKKFDEEIKNKEVCRHIWGYYNLKYKDPFEYLFYNCGLLSLGNSECKKIT